MTRKVYVSTIVLMLLCVPVLAQHKQVKVIFDSDGKIISFPSAVIKRPTEIAFKVKVPVAFLNKQKDQFLQYLKQDSTNIEKVDQVYTCLLGNDYNSYLNDLKSIITALDVSDFFLNQQHFTNTALKSNVHIPALDFVNRVINAQFQVKLYMGATQVETIDLKLGALTADHKYVYFESSKLFSGRDHDKGLKGTVTARNDYKFTLLRHDPLNETLVNWFNTSLVGLNGIDADQFKSGLDNIGTNDARIFTTSLRKVQTLNTWFVNWLWVTRGQLTLNPFKVPQDEVLKDLAAKIAEKNIHMAQLQQQQQFIDSCILKLRAREDNLTILKQLQDQAETTRKGIENDSARLSTMAEKYAAGTTALAKVATIPMLYNGMFYTSATGNVTVMKQFDAAMKYRPIYRNSNTFFVNRWSKERVTEVPENERVMLLVQNTTTNVKLNIDEGRQDFDDMEAFTRQTKDLLAQLDFTSTLSASGVAGLPAFAKGLINKTSTGGVFGGVTFANPANCVVGGQAQDLLVELVAKTDGFSLPFDQEPIQLKEADMATYSTYAQQAALDKYEAPFRDSISIQDVTKSGSPKEVTKSFLKVGALRHVQIAAGIAIVRTPVSTNTIDTTGNGFKVNGADNISNVIVGFKFYPVKSYNRDNSIIPRYPFRRLSVFGGFDMLHPLNNFYLGGGYDIVPGLSFIVGNNYYKQTAYTVSNNKVIDTKNSYVSGGVFYSVTVNPILFVQIIKTFFK